MKKLIQVDYDDAIVEVCFIREDYPMGYIYGGEIRPKDGSPYHGFEASFVMTAESVARVVYAAWKTDNLKKYQKNY